MAGLISSIEQWETISPSGLVANDRAQEALELFRKIRLPVKSSSQAHRVFN